MKKKKMLKLIPEIPKKSTAEISEVHALMNVMKAIEVKESQIKQKKKSEAVV